MQTTIVHAFSRLCAAFACAMIVATSAAAQTEPASTIPDWYLADIAAMTRDGGRWIADNPNRTEAEPYDQWGLEWRVSSDGKSMAGRLFGLRGGREVAEFFQFRQFWHPGERRVHVMQWGGDGMFGIGVLTPLSEDSGMLDQTFHLADGRSFRIGHIYRNTSPDVRSTEQYNIVAADGSWRLDHALIWRRERAR